MRTLIIIGIASLAACAKEEQQTPLWQHYEVARAELCTILETDYVYVNEKQALLDDACEKAKTITPTNNKEAINGLEIVVDAMYDKHLHLNTVTTGSPRLLPSYADIWVNENFKIIALRQDEPAMEKLEIGDIITHVNGIATQEKYQQWQEKLQIDTATGETKKRRMDYAVNRIVAGNVGDKRNYTVQRDQQSFDVEINDVAMNYSGTISRKLIDDKYAYIRINNALGDPRTVLGFYNAMRKMRNAEAYIIDLRETASGGGTPVAEPILGRFIKETQEYQYIADKDEPYNRQVKPSWLWQTEKPIIVLSGRWTGSMGEGMTIGFDALTYPDGSPRATIIGSEMARLAGGVYNHQIYGGYAVNYPAYDLHHLDGTPRHEWVPEIYVNADQGHGEDLALKKAIELLEEK